MAYKVKWLDIIDDPGWDELTPDQRSKSREMWMEDQWTWSGMTQQNKYDYMKAAKDFRERTNFQIADEYRPHRERQSDRPYSEWKAFGYGAFQGLTGGWWGPGGIETFYENEEEKKALEDIGAPTQKKWGWLEDSEDHYWWSLGGNLAGMLAPLSIASKITMVPRALKIGRGITLGAKGVQVMGGTMGTRLATSMLRAGARGAQIGAFYGFYKKPHKDEWKDLKNPWSAPWNEGRWWAQKAQDVLFEAGFFATADGLFGAIGALRQTYKLAKSRGIPLKELHTLERKIIKQHYGAAGVKLQNDANKAFRQGTSIIAKGYKRSYNKAAKEFLDITEEALKDSDVALHPEMKMKMEVVFGKELGPAAEKAGLEPLQAKEMEALVKKRPWPQIKPDISQVGKAKLLEDIAGIRKAKYSPLKEQLYINRKIGLGKLDPDVGPLKGKLYRTLVGRNAEQTRLLEKLRQELGSEMSDIGIFKEAMKRAREGVPEFAEAFKEPPIFELMLAKGKPLGVAELLKEPIADAELKMRDIIKEVIEIGDPQILKSLHNMEQQAVIYGRDVLRFNKQLAVLARDASIPVKQKEIYYDLYYGLMKSYEMARMLNTPASDLLHAGELAVQKWQTTASLGDWHTRKVVQSIKSIMKENKMGKDAQKRIFYYMNGYVPKDAKWAALKLGNMSKAEMKIAEVLRDELDTLASMLRDAGIPLEYRSHYFPLIWKNHPDVSRRFAEYFGAKNINPADMPARRPGLKQTFDFAKKRRIELEDGLTQGLIPIEDPEQLMSMYTRAAYRTLANNNLVNTLQALKVPYKGAWVQALVSQNHRLPGPAATAWKSLNIVGIPGGVKVAPGIFRQMKDIFDPALRWWEIPGYRGWREIRNTVKRMIMYNPIIHGSNIFSDVVNESLSIWKPWTWLTAVPKAVKTMRRGWKLWKNRDDMVELFVERGGNIAALNGVGTELNTRMANEVISEVANKGNVLYEAFNRSKDWVDKSLWEWMVTSAQIGLFEQTMNILKKAHPAVSKHMIERGAAHYVNDLLGTLTPTIFTTLQREGLSTLFFARNWTISNLRLITGMLGKTTQYGAVGGKGVSGLMGYGLPVPLPKFLKHGLGKTEMQMLQPLYTQHVVRGLTMLVTSASLFQIMMQSMTNHLKNTGVLDTDRWGPTVDVTGVWGNQPTKRTSVDTGLLDRNGNRVFFANFLFRYINDYVKWYTDPGKTFWNKSEPLMRSSIESLMNYSMWRSEKIADPGGAESWAEWSKEHNIPAWVGRKGYSVGARMKYIFESATPSFLEAIPGLGNPAFSKDPWEWAVEIASGTHKQRGVRLDETAWNTLRKDHKFEFYNKLSYKEQEQLMRDLKKGAVVDALGYKLLQFRQTNNYDRDRIDEQIENAMNQRPYPDVKRAIELIVENGRYTDWAQVQKKFKRHALAIRRWQDEEERKLKKAKEEEKHPGKEYVY